MANMNEQPLIEFTSMSRGATQTLPSTPTASSGRARDWGHRSGWPRAATNMIPVRQIQDVSTHKGGLAYTTVRVATGGDATEFRHQTAG
jgi:hypothetical protein